MNVLSGKKILLGITGGIAAYKCPELIRLLTQQGAIVRPVLTQCAKNFVTKHTLLALSNQPVYESLWDGVENMSHIELSRWADVILIAPATANFIAQLSHGFANDLLSTLCLASTSPIVIAPSMNQQMYINSITQANIHKLINNNFIIWGPGEGIQACGEVGPGRMLEPEHLLENLIQFFSPKLLQNKNIVITAGPTQEPLDPVRYLSNYSSGKMGYALAEAAFSAGAKVTLISGPTHLSISNNIKKVEVVTAEEMHHAVLDHLTHCDIFISAAAISDYKAENIATSKIKKTNNKLTITLTQNPDILEDVANHNQKIIRIGFAAETQNLLENAYKKLEDKNCHMIIANEVGKDRGFNSNDNQVSVITRSNTVHLKKASKKEISIQLIQLIHDSFRSDY
ncbi:MAG: bifunctional phosphopantothenoylcysteine decarboxylase/phosphopantothenate--cysteine ligase CoaBC [Gammaproteobacteria bacterium]|nr:bifunctional phosphopantothenoylcysteine decarboxylase/phosphopantothenate--cysteine ligase CoaBC [Gammaproteobacteria bacterium]